MPRNKTNLYRYRVKSDMTQQKLADIAGCHTSTICRIECGSLKPRQPILEKLANHFNAVPDELVQTMDRRMRP